MLDKHGHGTQFFGAAPEGRAIGQQIGTSSQDDAAKKIKEAVRPMILLPQSSDGMRNGLLRKGEEDLMGLLLACKELDIIHQQKIHAAEVLLEFIDLVLLDGFVYFFNEFQ